MSTSIDDPTAGNGKPEAARFIERSITLSVYVARRETSHRWQRYQWRAVSAQPDEPSEDQWRLVETTPGEKIYLACQLALVLHRRETEGYKYNLSGQEKSIYVIMRPTDEPEFPWKPVMLSVSPHEAMAGTEFGDDQVDAVPMDQVVETFVRGFVDRHHVDQPFVKRRRKGREKKLGELSDFDVVRDRAGPRLGHPLAKDRALHQGSAPREPSADESAKGRESGDE